MSSTEQDLKKKLEEDAKREAQRTKDKEYVEPKDPSGPFGSTKKVDGKTVNELGYKIGSPNGDELSGSVQQDNKNGTTTAKVKVSDGQTSAEVYVREQKGKEAGGVVVTHRPNAAETYSGSVERNNQTGTTTAKVEHQDGKDKQSGSVAVAPKGTTVSGAITEDMGKSGTVKAEASTNLKDRFKVGGGYTKDGVGGSFATEKSPDGWTNTYGVGVEKGRVKVEASVKDAPNKSPEVSVKGTVDVGPKPGKPEPTFWDKPELKQNPKEYGKFCEARDKLSPEDRKLFDTSLAAVNKAIESGVPGMSAYKGRETELAMNVALQAKTLGMTQVADMRTQPGPNGQLQLRLGEKSLDDPSLDNRSGPSSKTVSLNALDKPPMEAMNDLRTMTPEKSPAKTETSPTQRVEAPPNEPPARESSVQKR